MSRPIAYNKPGAAINGSITNEDAVISYVVDGRGNDYFNNYETCKWVPSADGAAPIVFVTDTFTRGYEGDPNLAVPLFFACAGTSSAAILYTANRLPGSPGNYTNANTAIDELNRTYGYFILESNDPFEGINATNLVFDMDASKMTSYPQTGNNVYDLSGYGGSGALNNGVSWVSNSGSFYFDGTDDEIYVTNYTDINMSGTQQYTAMSTVYPLLGGTTWHGIFSKGNNQQYALTINSPSAYLHYETNQSAYGPLNSAGGSVDVNRWQHFVAMYDGVNKTIWKNGEIIATQAAPGLSSTSNTEELRIGEGNNGENFRGEIQSTRVYRRALSTAEIKQNYFGSPIVTDGLVFAVDANNIVSYPKSGTAWYGLTGSFSGSLNNGPTFAPANGGSIVFDGADDFISTNLTQTFINELTVETWYRGTKLTRNHLWNFGSSVADNLHCNFNDSGLSLWVYWQGGGSPAVRYITPNFTDGSIHHLVFRHSGSVNQVYLDGQLLTPYDVLGTQTFTGGGVGGSYNIANSPNFGGNVYTNRVYNRALSAAEIQQNYQAEQYRFGQSLGYPTNGLLLYLDAGDYNSYPGTGTTWYDLSGNGANATMFNGMESGWNPTGYFQLDGTDDYADSINITQEYRDLIIGLWSESGGNLEMVFAVQGGADKSLRLSSNLFRTSVEGTDANDWNYLEDASTFGDGVFGQAVDCSGGWHIIRGYRSNNSFGTSFRYSISSTFLSSARMYQGKLAFILAYDRKLTQQEVLQIYWYFSENKLPA
jgi:hypothetical protein